MKRHIAVARPAFQGNEKAYVMDCLETSWISSAGKYIEQFEQSFGTLVHCKHAIATSNGTVALHLALLAYDVKPGDEIIVPTLTYVATANAVKYCGATPVFVDSEPCTWNIDPAKVVKKLSSRTKGIIAVHLYGHPVDMDPIMALAREYKLFVIEDAAEAHGAQYKGRVIGSIGDIATFSFYGNKILTTGEGGMVVTNYDWVDAKLRLLKGQGMDPNRRYWFPVIGYNYRMTNLQAAIGLAQLESASWHLQRRREIARRYSEHLRKLSDYVEFHNEAPWARHAFWMYTILVREGVRRSRDTLMQLLQEDGIETRPAFYPMHVLPPYFESSGHYPVAERIAARGINLPTHALLNDEDIEYIANRLAYHLKG
jgi:perosamine synthetase